MNVILIKIFATALALSQVTTRPDAVKTHFDPVGDRDEIVQILRDGCAHMRKAFDIEDINLDDLISTAMTDPQAAAGIKSFHGLEFTSLQAAYRQFCDNEPVDNATFDIGEIVGFYNKAVADLPDHTKLKGLKLSGLTTVLDGKGQPFTGLVDASGAPTASHFTAQPLTTLYLDPSLKFPLQITVQANADGYLQAASRLTMQKAGAH
jgi:penicillin-binding protein 1A